KPIKNELHQLGITDHERVVLPHIFSAGQNTQASDRSRRQRTIQIFLRISEVPIRRGLRPDVSGTEPIRISQILFDGFSIFNSIEEDAFCGYIFQFFGRGIMYIEPGWESL